MWRFDFEAERMLWNRVMTIIEANENYVANKKYKLLFVGPPPNYAEHYYGNNKRRAKERELLIKANNKSVGMLRGYSIANPSAAFSFFFPNLSPMYRTTLLKHLTNKNIQNEKETQTIKNIALRLKTQINNMHAYPHKNSVLIKNDLIIIVFSEEELRSVKKILNK